MLNKSFATLVATLSTGLILAPAAFAGSATSSLSVSSTIEDACLVSTTALSFGTYDPLTANNATGGSDLTTTGSVSIQCTNGTTPKILLGQGANADTGSTDASPVRRMKAGSNYMSYQLYQADGTTVWGNTDATGVAGTGDGASHPYTVNGVITKGQNLPKGSYTDTVVVTVNF